MQITDPIADMLTRIRNANSSKHESVTVPCSKLRIEIAKILDKEGYIAGYEVIEDEIQGIIKINLKYGPGKQKVITGLKRVYASKDNLPKVLKGLGIAIISTSKGIMTDKEARKLNVGGEVLAFVW